MIDQKLREAKDRAIDPVVRGLVALRVGAGWFTAAGLITSLAAGALAWRGLTWWALAAFLAGRVFDSVDGAVARRAGTASDLGVIARNYVGTDETGAVADADLRSRITRNKMDFDCFYKTLNRIAAESKASNGPSAATSIIKYSVAAFAQERSELIVEMMGSQGLGWSGDDFAPQEIGAVRGWLRAKANSIEGGSSEVNLNVISKRVLGLPDPA